MTEEETNKKELKLTRLGNSNISYDEDGNIWWEEEYDTSSVLSAATDYQKQLAEALDNY